MTRRLAPLAAFVLVALTACGGTDDEPDARGENTTALTDTPESSAASRETTCTLKGSKSAEVTLEDKGDAFAMTFDGQPIPASGTALYSVTLWDEAGENGVQLGMNYNDGRQIAYFAFDIDASFQNNLDGEPVVAGKTLTGTFPADALGDLDPADVVKWSAAFSVNGDDVGMCPGDYESQPFPG